MESLKQNFDDEKNQIQFQKWNYYLRCRNRRIYFKNTAENFSKANKEDFDRIKKCMKWNSMNVHQNQ
jgi:hypothetical protein